MKYHPRATLTCPFCQATWSSFIGVCTAPWCLTKYHLPFIVAIFYMAPGPITSWQVGGETVEAVADFIFLGSKITADSDCSHEIKRRLLLGRKAMINLDSVLKSRDITLSTKVHPVKAMVFPVVMYE